MSRQQKCLWLVSPIGKWKSSRPLNVWLVRITKITQRILAFCLALVYFNCGRNFILILLQPLREDPMPPAAIWSCGFPVLLSFHVMLAKVFKVWLEADNISLARVKFTKDNCVLTTHTHTQDRKLILFSLGFFKIKKRKRKTQSKSQDVVFFFCFPSPLLLCTTM